MLFPPGRSAASAVSAGTDWAIRNVATPARTTRIRIPAPLAPPANSRSPHRRTGRGVGAACWVVVTPAPRAGDGRFGRWPPGGPGRRRTPRAAGQEPCSRGRDRVDRLLALLTQ